MERRYSRSDFYNGKFYQLGKELFKGAYQKMSNNERVIYSVLKDRFELSVMNGWVDENNDIYFYFEQNQLAEECCISTKTVQRSLNILIENALLESVRQGLNRPNRLYLLKPEMQKIEIKEAANPDKQRTGLFDLSGVDKLTCLDRTKSPTNYTNNNYTNKNSSSSETKKTEEEFFVYEDEEGEREEIDSLERVKKLIDLKTEIEEDEVSSKICSRVRQILYQIVSPYDTEISSFKADGTIVELDLDMRKLLYQVICPKLFKELIIAIQNNSEPIKSMRAFVLACLYNYAMGRRSSQNTQKSRNAFNSFMQSTYDFETLEKELLNK